MEKKILQKIQKCLALSKSDNPHEAAAALRQAQKLMDKHLVTEADVAMAEVSERPATAGTPSATPPYWLVLLASVVEDAFGVSSFYQVRYRKTAQFVFVGISPALDIATYTFAVLRRQCAQARRARYKKLRGKRVNRIRRADAYATGWALAVDKQVKAFAKPVPSVVGQYLTVAYKLTSHKPIDRTTEKDSHDMIRGFLDGGDVVLNHGVGASNQERLVCQI